MKRIQNLYFIAALAVAASFVGCAKDEVSLNGDFSNSREVIISTHLPQLELEEGEITRSNPLESGATSSYFSAGDELAILMINDDSESNISALRFTPYVYDGLVWSFASDFDNAKLPGVDYEHSVLVDVDLPTYPLGADVSSSWGTSALEWLDDITKNAFMAYYPVNSTTSLGDFLLPLDQSTTDAIESADYMIGKTEPSVRPQDNSSKISMQRKTSRVVIQFVEDNIGWGITEDTKFSIFTPYSAYDDYVQTPERGAFGITPHAQTSDAMPIFTALVLPDKEEDKVNYGSSWNPVYGVAKTDLCTFVNNKGETHKLTRTTLFEPGYSYTYYVSVDGDGLIIYNEPVVGWINDDDSYVYDYPSISEFYIYDAQDLLEFAKSVNFYYKNSDNVYYGYNNSATGYVMADIDLADLDALGLNWESIGSNNYSSTTDDDRPFKGVLKGVDENLQAVQRVIKAPVSPFGSDKLIGVSEGATIENITLEGSIISGL